jgi:hypothetical protein
MKSVIRRFGKAAYKNHELLTEALFQHAHVQSFIMEVDSVYEASAYSSSYRAGMEVQDLPPHLSDCVEAST